MNETTHYDRLADLVVAVEGFSQPTTLHGALAGHLCAGGRWTRSQFIAQATLVLDSKVKPDAALQGEFQWLYDNTLEALQSEGMEFSPLMPDEDASIVMRLSALTGWINAFLTGFGSSGQSFATLTDDIKEILTDLAAIATVEVAEDEATEDDWYTVVEHVRLSAMHLYLAYNLPVKPNNTDNNTDNTTH